MGAAIGAILASAVGVAIGPVPIIAVILMLFLGAATSNSLSFLLGWITGLLGAGLIAGKKAEPTLNTMKEWSIANNATVMAVLFVVLGAKVFGDGIAVVAS